MKRLAAAVVVAGAVGLVIWLGFLRDSGPGPLADTGGGIFGLNVTPGHTVVLDYQLRRPLSVPAVLLGIRLLRPDDGRGVTFRYGARANFTGATSHSGWNLRAWHARPLTGFVIPAHHYGTLEIGMSSKRLGLHRIFGFILTYRIGSTTYNGPLENGIDLRVRKKL